MSSQEDASPQRRTRPFSEVPGLGQRAAELLLTPNALVPMSLEEAAVVVAHMRLVHFPQGATMLREGERARNDYLLLVLEGEVSVFASVGTEPDGVQISVLGPGAVIGEMALLDGSPRSASCIAVTPVQCAGLSRKGLEMMIEQHPKVAARLLAGLACRIADRLRAMSDQLRMYASLASPGDRAA